MERLKGAAGVIFSIDLWMSRKGEDVLSLNAHYIDKETWHLRSEHIKLVDCKDSSTGAFIAQQVTPILQQKNVIFTLNLL